MANRLLTINQFPGTPLSAIVAIDDGNGGYILSFNGSYNGLYPSDPTTIVAATPIKQLGGEFLLKTTDLVNLNTATATLLYTVPTGYIAVPTRFVIRAASTSLTTVSFSIGWNSATFNNVLADATHTELTGATLYTVLLPKTGAVRGVAGDTLKLLCNVLQGSAATCSVDVFGYIIGV